MHITPTADVRGRTTRWRRHIRARLRAIFDRASNYVSLRHYELPISLTSVDTHRPLGDLMVDNRIIIIRFLLANEITTLHLAEVADLIGATLPRPPPPLPSLVLAERRQTSRPLVSAKLALILNPCLRD